MDGDDIEYRNDYMPTWPPWRVSILGKVSCLLGFHKRETRKCGPKAKFPGMTLRDQCGRCGALL